MLLFSAICFVHIFLGDLSLDERARSEAVWKTCLRDVRTRLFRKLVKETLGTYETDALSRCQLTTSFSQHNNGLSRYFTLVLYNTILTTHICRNPFAKYRGGSRLSGKLSTLFETMALVGDRCFLPFILSLLGKLFNCCQTSNISFTKVKLQPRISMKMKNKKNYVCKYYIDLNFIFM